MGIVLRRFVVLFALLFWQGGALFYALVVVPTGRAVHGSILKQAEVRRQVTWDLNWLGVVCVLILLWDVFTHQKLTGRIALGRWLSWLGMTGSAAILLGLHPWLDVMMSR